MTFSVCFSTTTRDATPSLTRKTTRPPPPSLQTRVEGFYSFLIRKRHNHPLPRFKRESDGFPGPFTFSFTRKRYTHPLPHFKCESEGFPFLFHAKTIHAPPPSLQMRVGGVSLALSCENDTRTPSLASNAS